MAARSPDQLEEILRRKRSLSLNLKRALPASPGAGRSLSSCEVSEDPSLDPRSPAESDPDENHNRKRKIAAALNLVYPELTNSLETADTFHTAAADSPDKRLQFDVDEEEEAKDKFDEEPEETVDDEEHEDFKTSVDEIRVFQQSVTKTPEPGLSVNGSCHRTESRPASENSVILRENNEDKVI